MSASLDEFLEEGGYLDDTPAVTPEAPPVVEAAEGESISPADAAQPNVAADEEFAKQEVFKDQDAWGKFTQTLADVTGKELAELQKLPFAERMEALAELKEARLAQAELEKLSDFRDFTGIVVDKPAEQWNVSEQLNALPENHFDKLVNTVMSEQLGTFTQTVLSDMAAYPEESRLLGQSAVAIAQSIYNRSIDDIDAIMAMTEGMTPSQLDQLLRGQGNNGAVPYGSQPTAAPYSPYPSSQPQSQSQQLQSQAQGMYSQAQSLVASGYPEDDPAVVGLMNSASQLYAFAQQTAQMERERGQAEKRLQSLEQTLSQQKEAQKQEAGKQASLEIDKLADAARQGVLEQVTKGRLPEGKEAKIKGWIEREAGESLKQNPKAQAALELARAYRAEGLEAKAKTQLALYTQHADRAYKSATRDILSEFVAQTSSLRSADQQKAARKELGAGGGGASYSRTPDNFKDLKIGRDDNAGDIAVQRYRELKEARP